MSETQPAIHEGLPPNSDLSLVDLTGKTIGRFKVIGYSTDRPRWVLRCSCGMYTFRSNKALRRVITGQIIDGGDRCAVCCKLLRLKIRDYKNRHGKYPSKSDPLYL